MTLGASLPLFVFVVVVIVVRDVCVRVCMRFPAAKIRSPSNLSATSLPPAVPEAKRQQAAPVDDGTMRPSCDVELKLTVLGDSVVGGLCNDDSRKRLPWYAVYNLQRVVRLRRVLPYACLYFSSFSLLFCVLSTELRLLVEELLKLSSRPSAVNSLTNKDLNVLHKGQSQSHFCRGLPTFNFVHIMASSAEIKDHQPDTTKLLSILKGELLPVNAAQVRRHPRANGDTPVV